MHRSSVDFPGPRGPDQQTPRARRPRGRCPSAPRAIRRTCARPRRRSASHAAPVETSFTRSSDSRRPRSLAISQSTARVSGIVKSMKHQRRREVGREVEGPGDVDRRSPGTSPGRRSGGEQRRVLLESMKVVQQGGTTRRNGCGHDESQGLPAEEAERPSRRDWLGAPTRCRRDRPRPRTPNTRGSARHARRTPTSGTARAADQEHRTEDVDHKDCRDRTEEIGL